MSPDASHQDLAAYLASLPDREVASFLRARPDLARPSSASFSALAARAAARPSVEAALARLDAPTLALAEAVVALAGLGAREGIGDPGSPGDALGLEPDEARSALHHLERLGLVVEGRPVTGLVEAVGPAPFGLGPPAATLPAVLPPPLEVLERYAADSGEVPVGLCGDEVSGGGTLPGQVPGEAVVVLPRAAVSLLAALAWGPASGVLGARGYPPEVEPLLGLRWLERGHDPRGGNRLVLPREVGLALRGGRLVREALRPPDPGALAVAEVDAVASESAFHAEEMVRLVGLLLRQWRHDPAPVLRSGGVGVRALGRTAQSLELDTVQAATVIEAAASADLLGLDETGTSWLPSRVASDWQEDPTAARWAPLAAGWADSARTPWLVGTRDESGTPRPVLGADLEAGWARRLRRRVLGVLLDLPEGAVASAELVRAVLDFWRPRWVVPAEAVSAVLAEMEMLGLTGAGALSRSGRALGHRLVAGDRSAQSAAGLLAVLEEAMAQDLPDTVSTLLLQSDLTAVVPGRPEPRLARLLELASRTESRGGALTVRFTPESVQGALDAGATASELLAALEHFSPVPVPSALEAVVRDAARHHGAVRVRPVSSVLRVADPAVVAGLVSDSRLAGLGLDELAPGLLVSSSPSVHVLRALREAGLAPALEDGSGRLVLTAPDAERPTAVVDPARPGRDYSPQAARRRGPGDRDLAAVVGRLRAGQEERRMAGAGGAAASAADPGHVLGLLREARSSRAVLRLSLAGADGSVQERRARVVAVEPGRVRLRDLDRETELTAAVHRIVSVGQEQGQE
ncbi:helicase-associated domain-containing protein [Actinomyces wuliandei]|uniref:helicase-associated domain-containing protein n=1 Tax=Actinomyces wuliandei TaxID=2057743 RepID=UPI001FAA9FCA|nr:helicase-associated domain-containing protein [Actinomyces wuliandei]